MRSLCSPQLAKTTTCCEGSSNPLCSSGVSFLDLKMTSGKARARTYFVVFRDVRRPCRATLGASILIDPQCYVCNTPLRSALTQYLCLFYGATSKEMSEKETSLPSR